MADMMMEKTIAISMMRLEKGIQPKVPKIKVMECPTVKAVIIFINFKMLYRKPPYFAHFLLDIKSGAGKSKVNKNKKTAEAGRATWFAIDSRHVAFKQVL